MGVLPELNGEIINLKENDYGKQDIRLFKRLVRRPSIQSAGMVGSASTFQGGFSSGGFDSRPNEPTRLPSARSPARSPDRSPERSPEFVPERFSPERSPDQGMPERRFERTTNDRPTDRLPERTDRTSRGLDESEMRSLPRIRAASPSSPAGGATSPRAHGSPSLGFAADSSRLPKNGIHPSPCFPPTSQSCIIYFHNIVSSNINDLYIFLSLYILNVI